MLIILKQIRWYKFVLVPRHTGPATHGLWLRASIVWSIAVDLEWFIFEIVRKLIVPRQNVDIWARFRIHVISKILHWQVLTRISSQPTVSSVSIVNRVEAFIGFRAQIDALSGRSIFDGWLNITVSILILKAWEEVIDISVHHVISDNSVGLTMLWISTEIASATRYWWSFVINELVSVFHVGFLIKPITFRSYITESNGSFIVQAYPNIHYFTIVQLGADFTALLVIVFICVHVSKVDQLVHLWFCWWYTFPNEIWLWQGSSV